VNSEAKRGRAEMIGDIIVAIREELAKNGDAMLTRVQSSANIPFSRFKEYVEFLREKGLITMTESGNHVTLGLTESGWSYLRGYEQMKRFLSAFGLE
jgi:predicted transcriptional regulator